MSLCYENVGDYLVEAVPEFKPILDKHIEEYGELLPQIFSGDGNRQETKAYIR